MAAVACHRGRSRLLATSFGSVATDSVPGSADPPSRTSVTSIGPIDFAHVLMAGERSANTVQISAESVQDLRLRGSCAAVLAPPWPPARLPTWFWLSGTGEFRGGRRNPSHRCAVW